MPLSTDAMKQSYLHMRQILRFRFTGLFKSQCQCNNRRHNNATTLSVLIGDDIVVVDAFSSQLSDDIAKMMNMQINFSLPFRFLTKWETMTKVDALTPSKLVAVFSSSSHRIRRKIKSTEFSIKSRITFFSRFAVSSVVLTANTRITNTCTHRPQESNETKNGMSDAEM